MFSMTGMQIETRICLYISDCWKPDVLFEDKSVQRLQRGSSIAIKVFVNVVFPNWWRGSKSL